MSFLACPEPNIDDDKDNEIIKPSKPQKTRTHSYVERYADANIKLPAGFWDSHPYCRGVINEQDRAYNLRINLQWKNNYEVENFDFHFDSFLLTVKGDQNKKFQEKIKITGQCCNRTNSFQHGKQNILYVRRRQLCLGLIWSEKKRLKGSITTYYFLQTTKKNMTTLLLPK